jgi:hypothetical protein
MIAYVGQEVLSNLAILEKALSRLLARAEAINLFKAREKSDEDEKPQARAISVSALRTVPHLKDGLNTVERRRGW